MIRKLASGHVGIVICTLVGFPLSWWPAPSHAVGLSHSMINSEALMPFLHHGTRPG